MQRGKKYLYLPTKNPDIQIIILKHQNTNQPTTRDKNSWHTESSESPAAALNNNHR